MKPAPSEPSDDPVNRLRQQLILAQVRILELEDIRDDRDTKLAELDRLLAGLQGKADGALADFDNLQGAHAELLRHRDHLNHLLHVANQSLEEARRETRRLAAELDAATARGTALQSQVAQLTQQAQDLAGKISQLETSRAELESRLAALTAEAAARAARISQLDAELRAMKASRSWRWTQPLRAIERLFRRS